MKKSPLTPKLTISQEISVLETLPKDQLISLRKGFLLQKELALPIVNITLAEFLYRGKFSSDKNMWTILLKYIIENTLKNKVKRSHLRLIGRTQRKKERRSESILVN